MSEPSTKEEYETRYMANFEISGFGIEGVTNHFPCPFCAAPGWHVVRVIDFGPPPEEGKHHTEPIECGCCGRAAKYESERKGGSLVMRMVQTGGPDAPEWVPIAREETKPEPAPSFRCSQCERRYPTGQPSDPPLDKVIEGGWEIWCSHIDDGFFLRRAGAAPPSSWRKRMELVTEEAGA